MSPEAPRPSIPSRIPTSGSSGTPYIIASVVLVLIIAGLLWWKFGSSKPAPPPVVVPSASATNTVVTPAFDLPPPPPVEDAGGDAEDSGKKVATGGPAGGLCNSQCAGTDNPALSSALRSAAGAARGCYERALRTNSMLQGRLKIAVRVASNGTVCSASLAEDSLHSGEVSSCVLSLFRSKFPPPSGGSCVDVTIPVSFTPQEGKK